MKKWQPVDILAGVLILSIFYEVVMMSIMHFFVPDSPVGDLKIKAQFMGSLISIIALYFGARLNNKDDE